MLSGPSFIPSHPTSAVILCHGYGANGADLIELAPFFKNTLPQTAFFCPNAPTPLDFGGYEWFSLNDFDPRQTVTLSYLNTLANRALPAAKQVQALFHHVQETLNLSPDKMALGGFSQGGLVAQMAALTDKVACAGVLAFSSVPLVFQTALPLTAVTQHLPILLTHGGRDDVINPKAQYLSKEQLESAGQRPTLATSPLLGHGIDDICLNAARDFLKHLF